MDIHSRLSDLVGIDLTALVSNAEDPQPVLSQLALDMWDALVEGRKHVDVATQGVDRIEATLEHERHSAREWKRKAMVAVRAGQDDLAREALSRKQDHDTRAAEHEKQTEEKKIAANLLMVLVDSLELKLSVVQRLRGENTDEDAILTTRKSLERAAQRAKEEARAELSDGLNPIPQKYYELEPAPDPTNAEVCLSLKRHTFDPASQSSFSFSFEDEFPLKPRTEWDGEEF